MKADYNLATIQGMSDDKTNTNTPEQDYMPIGETVQIVDSAQDEHEVRRRHASNRLAWNEGAVRYREELNETLEELQAGKSNLHPIERDNLRVRGKLADWCKRAIHLQCASGRDSLSLWLEGAHQVIGVDISDVHITNAQRLSDALDAPATWYCCDVLDTPHALDGSADLVYTGRGALNWLHDLTGWAHVIARLLKPGGMFHVFDGHPAAWLFEPAAHMLVAAPNISYFQHSETSRGWTPEYIGDLTEALGKSDGELTAKFERLWPLADIFQALTGAGLIVDFLGEYPEDYWPSMPNLADSERGRIPLTFAMRAHKPH